MPKCPKHELVLRLGPAEQAPCQHQWLHPEQQAARALTQPIDEKRLLAAAASGKFAVEHYGKVLDEASGRAAWTIFCRLSSKDERYQQDDENFRAFFTAATKAAREALREERRGAA